MNALGQRFFLKVTAELVMGDVGNVGELLLKPQHEQHGSVVGHQHTGITLFNLAQGLTMYARPFGENGHGNPPPPPGGAEISPELAERPQDGNR
ncbi:hypothetical protein AUC68_04765 [Methyloceanibacter methanicus]|uniref:Uncharacterized protein n=1 Tax=Methyloceanibacter methanicus TaxID=1774968 RepID=A0A1E3W0H3_9HYPH|nr:hypothetical protein AUC68_04765 [Methyloceanibacter methanicus]